MAERTEREVLNMLIETCKDGAMGFKTAAEHVDNPELRAMFLNLAEERDRFAAELLPYAQRLGGAAASEGTNIGAIHRKWIDLKSALVRHDDHALVIEASRGDRATVHAYKDAIEGMLPPEARDVIERQFEVFKTEHEKLTIAENTGAKS